MEVKQQNEVIISVLSDAACQGHLAGLFMSSRRPPPDPTQFTNTSQNLLMKYVCAPSMNCERNISPPQDGNTDMTVTET